MRDDLVQALQRGGIDPRGLNAIHRILLTTDGTVTDMLEAYFQEPMEVVPLAQHLVNSRERVAELDLDAGHPILQREILRCTRREAGPLAGHFHLYETAPFLARTYIISVGGHGIMRITETFPEQGMYPPTDTLDALLGRAL